MAGSSFGSLHAGMLLRAETEGETPAANKQSNRASVGVLQRITPEHLLHPETRATGVRSGPEFETPGIEEQQAIDLPVRRAPFDRGFGHRVAKKTTAANGSTAAAPTPPAPGSPATLPDAVVPEPAPTPAIDEQAAAVEALFKPRAGGAEEPASPAPADAAPTKVVPVAEKAKAPAWRRRMFGGGQREQATPAGSARALPSAEAAPEPLADTVAEAPRLLPGVQPAEVPPATGRAHDRQPKLASVKPRSAARIRKQMTVRIEMRNFHRLLAAGASLKLTRQDILARAVDRYLDDLGISLPDADGDRD